MEIGEVKKYISDKTGIPVNLLNGDTVEENISRAAALLMFRDENIEKPIKIKSNEEQFMDWVNESLGIKVDEDETTRIIHELKEELLVGNAVVNNVSVNNDTADSPVDSSSKSTSELFSDWFNSVVS